MRRGEAAARVAARFEGRALRHYIRWKIESDPMYDAVLEVLRSRPEAIIDVGCGVGLLPFYLREQGLRQPVVGIDHDLRKIEVARAAGRDDPSIEFHQGDARESLPHRGNVVMFDVLHYFTAEERLRILRNVIDVVVGVVIIRDAVRDSSWRYRLTAMQETFSRSIGWLRAARLDFPTCESIVTPFQESGFESDIRPMWGRTPFNNYLFVFRRSSEGITNE